MPTYIVGFKRTEKGHQNLKEFSSVMERTRRVHEANGGKLLTAYATFGRFDLVAIVDFPSGTAMQKAMTTVLSDAHFTVEVAEAMPLDDFVAMLQEEERER